MGTQAVDKDRLFLHRRSQLNQLWMNPGCIITERSGVRRLLRGQPFVGAHQLDGHVGDEDVEWCAVGGSAVLG